MAVVVAGRQGRPAPSRVGPGPGRRSEPEGRAPDHQVGGIWPEQLPRPQATSCSPGRLSRTGPPQVAATATEISACAGGCRRRRRRGAASRFPRGQPNASSIRRRTAGVSDSLPVAMRAGRIRSRPARCSSVSTREHARVRPDRDRLVRVKPSDQRRERVEHRGVAGEPAPHRCRRSRRANTALLRKCPPWRRPPPPALAATRPGPASVRLPRRPTGRRPARSSRRRCASPAPAAPARRSNRCGVHGVAGRGSRRRGCEVGDERLDPGAGDGRVGHNAGPAGTPGPEPAGASFLRPGRRR